MRELAHSVEYKSMEAMETVVMEYVKAEPVWINFMNRAMHFGFDDIFHDMIEILHFIYDVREFKESHEDSMFIDAAADHKELRERTLLTIGDGIRKFLDYAIELKRDEKVMFENVMAVFENAPSK